MASVTAIGPALNVDGPLPVAPLHGLLTLPRVVVEDASDRWLNGVNVWGYPCDTPQNWDPCNDPSDGTKDIGGGQPVPRFDAFQAYLPITCTMGSLGPPEAFAERARAVLDATLSMAIESAIAQGTGVSTNPYFGDVNLVDPAGGVVSPGVGLSYLEDAIGATGRQGLIHLTPAVAAALQAIPLGPSPVASEPLITPNGTRVVVGDGYIGTNPVGKTASSAGHDWIFATGPVEVYRTETEIISPRVADSIDLSNNILTYRAEVSVLAMWDTCLQAGVLVNWT